MAIKLQIGDAFRRDEIDSPETLARIREEAQRQGFCVSPMYGIWPVKEEILWLNDAGDLRWAWKRNPKIERIVSVSDLLAPDKPQGHPSAGLLAEIAEVAARNPRPWEEFETLRWTSRDKVWEEPFSFEHLLGAVSSNLSEVRRKPRTVTRTLDGETGELPAPETEAPECGAEYFTPAVLNETGCARHVWGGTKNDHQLLLSNLVHITPESAQAWTRFFRAAAKGGNNDD